MKTSRARVVAGALLSPLFLVASASAAEPLRQSDADAYSRYELLEPASRGFRIVYDVSATTPGARAYYNPIRRGSEPTVHAVTDLATGKALEWRLIDGEQAIADGLVGAEADQPYLRITLPRPVPALELAADSISPPTGEVRLRIDKTYRDPVSYRIEGDRLLFERSLGIARNAVVLPSGWELVAANHPVQVAREEDGRIRLSFLRRGAGAVSLAVEGRRLPESGERRTAVEPVSAGTVVATEDTTVRRPGGARTGFSFAERAFQDREIVYELGAPETHSFRLYHDYTETRAGVGHYLNVVRPGSRASRPEAWSLDSGERLRVETLRAAALRERGIDPGSDVEAEAEVVAIWFEPVPAGGSLRLRIEETYTDPSRYGWHDGELLWDRTFGRPRNVVVLPPGFFLTSSSIPATVDSTDDGRIRLTFINDRPDEIAVHLRARPR